MFDHVNLFFFTGTGNSYRVAEWIAAMARERGIDADIMSITGEAPDETIPGKNKLLGLIGPTHAFTAPWWMIRFALRLQRGQGTRAFIIMNRAGMKFGPLFIPGLEGTAVYLLALILAIKGYKIRGATGMDMPSNWTVLHPGLDKVSVEEIIARAGIRVEFFTKKLLNGESVLMGWLSLLLGMLLIPVSLAYLILGRFLLSKLFYPSQNCTGCGICAKACPVNAIKMKRLGKKSQVRPFWTLVCESCGRCMNYCPQQAVEASYPFAALAVYIMSIPVAAKILDWAAHTFTSLAGLKGSIVEWIIDYPWKLLSLVVAYAIFALLLQIPWFNRLVTIITPTHYYARYHEPKTNLHNLKS